MKKLLLKILFFIVIIWLIVFFVNQGVDNTNTIRNIEFSNMSESQIKLKLTSISNKNKEKILNKNDKYSIKMGEYSNVNLYDDFTLLNSSYSNNFNPIFNKMKLGDLYNYRNYEIKYENQKIASTVIYFPLYLKTITNEQNFSIRIINK